MSSERPLPRNKEDWPCPTCKRIVRTHTNSELGRCHIVALLNCVLGKGPGWAIVERRKRLKGDSQ